MTMIYIAQDTKKVAPADLECHVCNGMVDAQCNDPFGRYAENGNLVNPENFIKKCNDPKIKKELGFTEEATMCRKIYQDGKKLYY